jgi:hypothetical protein
MSTMDKKYSDIKENKPSHLQFLKLLERTDALTVKLGGGRILLEVHRMMKLHGGM